MAITITIKVNNKRWLKLQQQLRAAEASGTGTGPIADMYKQWGKRYLAQVKRRFATLSRSGGGGEWPPLKMSTLLRRRIGGGSGGGTIGKAITKTNARFQKTAHSKAANDILRGLYQQLAVAQTRKSYQRIYGALASAAILRNTGLLFNAIDVGATGNLFKLEPGGILVGFAGAAHGTGKANIAQIASYHDQGGVHLPRRQILVAPDDQTITGMEADARRAFMRLTK
jgi:hypothetical protein